MVKLTPGITARTNTCPRANPEGLLLVRKMRVLAVTVLLATVTVEGTKRMGTNLAIPIRAFAPSLINNPEPTLEIATPEIDALVFSI